MILLPILANDGGDLCSPERFCVKPRMTTIVGATVPVARFNVHFRPLKCAAACVIISLNGCGMMIKLIICLGIALVVLGGCRGQRDITEGLHVHPPPVRFLSIEEFLEAHMAVADGIDNNFGFASNLWIDLIEKLHLPLGIPDSYGLFHVVAEEWNVQLMYLPKELLESEELRNDALRDRYFRDYFRLWMSRPGVSLDGAEHSFEQSDRLDRSDRITWLIDRGHLSISIPPVIRESIIGTGRVSVAGMTFGSIDDMIGHFIQIYTLDLQDRDAVTAFLEEVAEY